jgi:hypothetical protein
MPLPLPAGDCLGRCQAGRIFAPSGELKWRLIGPGCCRALFLGSADWVGEGLKPRSELQGLSPKKLRCFLWGQQSARTPGEWVELRIPHRFRYPLDAQPPAGADTLGARVVVEVWSDASGEPHFVRLCDLTSWSAREKD